MQRTPENFELCLRLISDVKVLQRDQPRDPEVFDKACKFLVETLMDACSRPDIAEEMVGEILRNEDRFPVPATIRRYLRECNYIEADVSAKRDKKEREEAERRKSERKPEPEQTIVSMDTLYRLMKAVGDDERKVLAKEYEACQTPEEEERFLEKWRGLLRQRKSAQP